ncbi:MAG: zinc transporter ZupT [Candidatus Nanoarchaeia archaeon]
MQENVLIALLLTAFAGMATAIGSVIAFVAKRSDYRFLSIATGFSGGVMLYVSFVEILPKGQASLAIKYGDYLGSWFNLLSFFAGIALIALIDNLIPSAENPHKIHVESERIELLSKTRKNRFYPELATKLREEKNTKQIKDHVKLMRMGLFTALVIGIHNFPEGLATFLAALQNPKLGVAIAIAIALHNIPEGISVSIPIFYATGNRKKAFILSVLSGIAEPAGALIAFLALRIFAAGSNAPVPEDIMGMLFGSVAGIMVYISVDELLPTSRAYGKGHDSIIGLITGMLAMGISLLLLK